MSTTQKLLDAIPLLRGLSDEFKHALKKEVIHLEFPKDYFLLESPRIAGHLYFLLQGMVLSYSYQKGKKITEAFYPAGQVIVSFTSFFEQVPSLENMQLMTSCKLLCIRYERVMYLLNHYAEARHLLGLLTGRYANQCKERMRDYRQMNATKRFEKLVSTIPGLEQHVSQEAIASYLGIAAQSLSRIKSQTRKQHIN